MDYKELPIPNNMEQAILNQIKDWNSYQLKVVEIVSIFSNSVSIEILRKFIVNKGIDIEKEINDLVIKGVLYRKIDDNGFTFDITNKILKDIAYEKINKNEKLAKHFLAATILEENYIIEKIGNIDELIYHFERAGIRDKVIKYSIENAKRMEGLKNRKEEIKNLEKALSMVQDENSLEKIEFFLFKIGCLYRDYGDASNSLEYFIKAEEISKKTSNNKFIIDVCIKIADTYLSRNDIKM